MALILLYHRIAETPSDPWALNVSPNHFEQHLSLLCERMQPVPLAALVEARESLEPSDRRVAVTFDDGYADNVHAALPMLEHFQVPATFFVPSAAVGATGEYWWDELDALLLQPGALPAMLRLDIDGDEFSWELGGASSYRDHESRRDRTWVAWEAAPTARHALYYALWSRCQGLSVRSRADVLRQLRDWAGMQESARATHRTVSTPELGRLERSALAEIAGHTVTHPKLSALGAPMQRYEIEESKRALERAAGAPVRAFSYPYGKFSDFTPETVEIVRDAGYTCACCNVNGVVGGDADPFRLPRLFVNNLRAEAFAAWLSAFVP
jgi:peptidoglycan/xylan/chitin deacetylase (PgdA/CDA1 family)